MEKVLRKLSPLTSDIFRARKKVVVCRGGTRSSKTMSICNKAIAWLIEDNGETGYWSVCRRTLPALRASAMRDFEWLINDLGLGWLPHNKTENTWTYNGKCVEFFSLDDEQKIRSRKRRHLHLCESNEVSFDTFMQLAIRTSGQIYLDFNPDDINSWMNVEIEQKRAELKGDVDVIVSTYRDNPYLLPDEISEIEYLKSVDSELWAIFGEGKYGKITGLVFPHVVQVKEFPADEMEGKWFIGLDWGFSNDPTAAIRVGKVGNKLYMDELLYQTGLVNSEIAHEIKHHRKMVVADSAEPKSIEDLSRAGISIVPSVKGPDSVRNGILSMKEYTLHVTSRSINLIRELQRYKYDASGSPIDAYNHGLDAVRYVVNTKLKRRGGMSFFTGSEQTVTNGRTI